MGKLRQFLTFIQNVGVEEADPFPLMRRKAFFNSIMTLGVFGSTLQAITAFQVDAYAVWFHLSWGVCCILSILVHHYSNFTFARVVAFVPIFVFGAIASARLGAESLAHVGSITVIIAVFILYDIKKEWGWILFYFLLQLGTIILPESNLIKAPNADDFITTGSRTMTLVFTMVFISIEFIFFIRMSMVNERNMNQRLRDKNLELKMRNKEKDLLLKEIHHRVKNNLQIISSLLRLQSNDIDDPKSKEKFTNSVNRIKSISNLHEAIYKSENLFRIDLNSYLSNLTANLVESYSIQKKINLSVNSELMNVQNDYIIPISLILNEMISNSLKHGFSETDECQISVEISRVGSTEYRLNYMDNGRWVQPKKEGFGTELIQSLTEQLNGRIERGPDEHKTEYVILFEVNVSDRI